MKIGIQGGVGSTNERVCKILAEKHGWENYEIEYLITTENVLKALNEETIDLGLFAWKSSKVGVVPESEKAVPKYTFEVVDNETVELDHGLFAPEGVSIDMTKPMQVFSHPQALRIHGEYLEKIFPHMNMMPEEDTALSVENLSKGKYPANSMAIGPLNCADLYPVQVLNRYLPGNIDYKTTFWLVSSKQTT